jgi:hypothetical protein
MTRGFSDVSGHAAHFNPAQPDSKGVGRSVRDGRDLSWDAPPCAAVVAGKTPSFFATFFRVAFFGLRLTAPAVATIIPLTSPEVVYEDLRI